jgi:hypothetical protein
MTAQCRGRSRYLKKRGGPVEFSSKRGGPAEFSGGGGGTYSGLFVLEIGSAPVMISNTAFMQNQHDNEGHIIDEVYTEKSIVYGLCLLGNFFSPQVPGSSPDPQSYVTSLRSRMQSCCLHHSVSVQLRHLPALCPN